MNKASLYAIIIILLLCIIGILFSLQYPLETNIDSQGSSLEEDSVLMQNYQQSSFNEFTFEEQVLQVTKKYFSTCNEVSDFCKTHPYVKACKETCGRFYFVWNVSENAT